MSDVSDKGLVFPRWFLYVVASCWALFVILFLPWGIWVTVQLMSIGMRQETYNNTQIQIRMEVDKMDARLRDLEMEQAVSKFREGQRNAP